ncbi:hypothetical protein [Azospirillum thermophilum]|uniref:Uncharacterized protein n=1 Tax=Azospirillum thermophilum TaxID=2202148 RepID=A0A2S2CV01_9PROT|nr:hypothetical protein [Azospirillum thermophilum]AWK88306.1 hypothetical protein DEW08_19640 [Azospirillum thermophilum]
MTSSLTVKDFAEVSAAYRLAITRFDESASIDIATEVLRAARPQLGKEDARWLTVDVVARAGLLCNIPPH